MLFVERMNERDRVALYDTAAEGAALLTSLGHPWWLSHGTLLGAWRHRGLIPWDDDLDMAFPRARAGELKAAAESQGWQFARLGPFVGKMWKPEAALYRPKRPWTWPFVDIAFYDEFRSKVIVESNYHSSFKAFDRSQLVPTRLAPFGPLELPVPKSPEVMLNHLYPFWSTWPTSGFYCHRMEGRYREPRQRASIAELSARFEFFNIPEAANDVDVSIYFGEHAHWSGPLHFFPDGRMCRPGIDHGSYEIEEGRYIVLRWDRWAPDTLVWIEEEKVYRSPTNPFTLKPLQR